MQAYGPAGPHGQFRQDNFPAHRFKDVLLSLDSVCLRIDDNARVLRLRAYLVDLEAHHKEEIGPRAVYGVGRIRVEICGAAG